MDIRLCFIPADDLIVEGLSLGIIVGSIEVQVMVAEHIVIAIFYFLASSLSDQGTMLDPSMSSLRVMSGCSDQVLLEVLCVSG